MSGVALILGVGPGIGNAVAKQWASKGFKVACVARNPEKVAALAAELGSNAIGISCDVTSQEQMTDCVARVERELGPIDFMCYNAGNGVFKDYKSVTPQEFESSWRTNSLGLLLAAQLVCPGMEARGKGVVAITGATASLRGKPFTSAFAPAKGAQRMLAQSLARQLNPAGVHVFLAIIDGGVAGPAARARAGDKADEVLLAPAAIAQTYWDVAAQPRSCWTSELDMRPHVESW
mmetsp:Transcript_33869/g.83074  ORF Transcript_33869/g.83074 Transcript_33869/m.83074 type:complete len:234 (-) Transcript_33869:123-824(-)